MLTIDSGYYYAGLIFEDNLCVQAAPILKWAIGKDKRFLINYFLKKKFKVVEI